MNCPIPNTHNRLNEAHRLWHQALSNYFDPEGFRTNLNALIQSLRNLTFALQAEQKGEAGFEEWYKIWQDRMKADSIMKWLNEARVKIVHQRDLDTKSISVVKVHGYYDLAQFTLNVYPFLSTENIAKYTKEKLAESIDIPLNQLSECVAIIERKWVVSDLPDYELLDAIQHCFQLLSNLVYDAHDKAGMSIDTCSFLDHLHNLDKNELLSGNYSCMNTTDIRTSQVLLSDFSTVRLKKKKISTDRNQIKQARKRYPKGFELNCDFDPDTNFISYAEYLNKIALEVLTKDKYHQSVTFIHIPDKGWELYSTNAEDKTHRFLIMNKLAEFVKESHADAFIDINESWITSDIDSLSKGMPVSETQNKREALHVSVYSSSGISRTYSTLFKRGILGRILLEETIINEGGIINYIQPILRVWKKNEKDC